MIVMVGALLWNYYRGPARIAYSLSTRSSYKDHFIAEYVDRTFVLSHVHIDGSSRNSSVFGHAETVEDADKKLKEKIDEVFVRDYFYRGKASIIEFVISF